MGAWQGLSGGLLGGVAGGIRASQYGGDWWSGNASGLPASNGLSMSNIRSQNEYSYLKNEDYLMASTNNTNVTFGDPAQINWNSRSNKKGAHLFKWIRHENTFGDKVLDINQVFKNYNSYSHGYSSEDIRLVLQEEKIKAFLDIGIIEKTTIDVSFGKIVNTKCLTENGGIL